MKKITVLLFSLLLSACDGSSKKAFFTSAKKINSSLSIEEKSELDKAIKQLVLSKIDITKNTANGEIKIPLTILSVIDGKTADEVIKMVNN